MPDPKRPLKVFLSYTHADEDAVKNLYDLLKNDGVDVWMDKQNLFGGSNWEYEIRKAVRNCDIFVVCVTAQFTKRYSLKNFSQTEVGIALNEAALKPKDEVFIVPVRLEDCKVPKQLTPWQWVDLFGTDGYQKLVLSLNRRIDQISENEQEQSGKPNISIIVRGNVQGNIIVGSNNTAQFSPDSTKELDGKTENAVEEAPAPNAQVEAVTQNVSKPSSLRKTTPFTGTWLTFLIVLTVFFGGLFTAHRMVGTPLVPNVSSLFRIAPGGDWFYYPDLNALLFDILIHPSVFAVLAFLQLYEDQHRNVLRFPNPADMMWWERSFSFGALIVMPILLGIYSIFSAYDSRYQYYDLAQPLLAVALAATGLSIAGISALSSRSLFTAWNLVQATSSKLESDEQKNAVMGILKALAIALLLFISEAGIMWWASVLKGAPANDFLWVGTSVICIAAVTGLSVGIVATGWNLRSRIQTDLPDSGHTSQ